VQHLTYLAVLLACLLLTAPLELVLRARVYGRWRRAAAAILPVAAVFVLWDYLATAAGWWWFDEQFVTGVFIGILPLEELMFFLVVPICALLTFEAVRRLRPGGADAAAPDLEARR
jgi:lycopene cyclase domain-containing protein